MERATVRGRSPVGTKYDPAVNRESAHEMLGKRAVPVAAAPPPPPAQDVQTREAPAQSAVRGQGSGGGISDMIWGTSKRQGMVEAMAKSAARTVGSQMGRQILRGVLGGILGGSRRG